MFLSAVFIAIIAAIMFLDFIAAHKNLPASEKILESMRAQITLAPEDAALRENFAQLDLIYRRAVFTSSAQIQTGALLLLLGAGLLLLSIAANFQLSEKKPAIPEKDSLKIKTRGAYYFRLVLVLMFSLCLLAASAYFIKNFLLASAEDSPPKKAQAAYSSLAELDENWTSLRGSRNDGIARSLNLANISKLEEVWKLEPEFDAFNSPVIYKDKLFVSFSDENARTIFCHSKTDGNLLWRCDFKSAAKSNHDDQSGPAPSTMSVDAERVYAIFPTGELICADMEGKLVYSKFFGTPEILYSYASSLLVCENTLIVQMYLEKNRVLYALDASSGRELWTAKDGKDTSWSSPSLVEHEGKKYVIVATCTGIESFDFLTGNALWKVKCMSGEMAPSITFGDGKILASNEYASTVALNPADGAIIWRNENLISPGVASPVYADGVLYLFSSGGTVSLVNVSDGKLIQEFEFDDGFYSSPIALGKIILACDNVGKIYALKTGGDFKIEKPLLNLDKTIYPTPAFSEDSVYVRAENFLSRFKIVFGGGASE